MYDFGRGVTQNYAEAVKWYKLAAAQGDAKAQHNLGLMYYEGQGVPQDFVLAHMWTNLAAAQAHKGAEEIRDIAAKRMTTAQIEKAQQMARDCLGKHYKNCR
jgi:TPR repeat protein